MDRKVSQYELSCNRSVIQSQELHESTRHKAMLKNYFILLTVHHVINGYPVNIQTDGWIPISYNVVYNQIKREWPPIQMLYTSVKLPENPQIQQDISPKYDSETDENDITNVGDTKYKVTMENNNGQLINNNLRNARKLVPNYGLNKMVDDGFYVANNKEHIKTSNTTNKIQAEDKYDVTEETIIENHENITPKEANGYQYTPPNEPQEETENLTANFRKILAKYNIKPEDKLPNYDLSRRDRAEHAKTRYSTHRYNSLNHLPVDPLLAVFLSNYGVYLPNLFGIKSNYNNLYGYLASNNIHNNKPFGLYKIFSDTDSSN